MAERELPLILLFLLNLFSNSLVNPHKSHKFYMVSEPCNWFSASIQSSLVILLISIHATALSLSLIESSQSLLVFVSLVYAWRSQQVSVPSQQINLHCWFYRSSALFWFWQIFGSTVATVTPTELVISQQRCNLSLLYLVKSSLFYFT